MSRCWPSTWTAGVLEQFQPAYRQLREAAGTAKILLATYFGSLEAGYQVARNLPIDVLHLDFVRSQENLDAALREPTAACDDAVGRTGERAEYLGPRTSLAARSGSTSWSRCMARTAFWLRRRARCCTCRWTWTTRSRSLRMSAVAWPSPTRRSTRSCCWPAMSTRDATRSLSPWKPMRRSSPSRQSDWAGTTPRCRSDWPASMNRCSAGANHSPTASPGSRPG